MIFKFIFLLFCFVWLSTLIDERRRHTTGLSHFEFHFSVSLFSFFGLYAFVYQLRVAATLATTHTKQEKKAAKPK